MTQTQSISSTLAIGDEGKPYAQTEAPSGITVTVYESLVEPGRIVIEVDGPAESAVVAVNDYYVHGRRPQ